MSRKSVAEAATRAAANKARVDAINQERTDGSASIAKALDAGASSGTPTVAKRPAMAYYKDGVLTSRKTLSEVAYHLGYVMAVKPATRVPLDEFIAWLATDGVTDPYSEWDATLPTGKRLSARLAAGSTMPTPIVPESTRPASGGRNKAAERIANLAAMKAEAAEHEALTAAVDGSKVPAPKQPKKVAAARKSRKAPPAAVATA